MKQENLWPDEKHFTFAGRSYVAKQDNKRLTHQIKDVFNVLKDGRPHTINEIHSKTGHLHESIGAQIRNLRKPENGGFEIPREYIKGTKLSQYQLSPQDMRNL